MVVAQKTLDLINELLAHDGLKAVFTPKGLVMCSLENKNSVSKETDPVNNICQFLDTNGLKFCTDPVTGKVYIVSKSSINMNNQQHNFGSFSRGRPTSNVAPDQYQHSPAWFRPAPNFFMGHAAKLKSSQFTPDQCPHDPYFLTDEFLNELAAIKDGVDRVHKAMRLRKKQDNPYNHTSGWGGWQATAKQETDNPSGPSLEQFNEFNESVKDSLSVSLTQTKDTTADTAGGGESPKPTANEAKPDDNAQPVWSFTGALDETILAVKKRIEVLNDLFTPGKYTDNLSDELLTNVLRELGYLQVLLQCQNEQHEMLYGKTL